MTHQAARIFIVGISGSGKTTGAYSWFLKSAPRVIIVDQTGEWEGRVNETVNTLDRLYAAIQAARKEKTWRISYTNLDGRLHDLIRWLIPLPHIHNSPSLAMGGIVLMLDEVDLIAPVGGAPEVVRNLYRRSRHANLTVISATQRPANVLREVSAQSTQVLAYRLSEPRDLDYLADLMRWNQDQVGEFVRWTRRYPHGAVWRDLVSGSTLWVPDRGSPRKDSGERHSQTATQRIPEQPPPQQLPGREILSPSGSPESSDYSISKGSDSKAPNETPET